VAERSRSQSVAVGVSQNQPIRKSRFYLILDLDPYGSVKGRRNTLKTMTLKAKSQTAVKKTKEKLAPIAFTLKMAGEGMTLF